MSKKNRKGMVSMILGALCVLTAMGMVVYNSVMDFRAEKETADVLEQFPISSELPEPPEAVEITVPTEKPYYVLNPEIEMPTVNINGDDYIGILEIPELKLTLSVMSELSSAGLKKAPCRYKGSIYQHNMIIAGHNYRSHFSGIKKLSVGAAVRFTDADGNIFDYTVTDIELINGTAVEEMEAGEWDLTLFTCNYGGKARVTLRCMLNEAD